MATINTTSAPNRKALACALAAAIAVPCEGLRQRVYLDPVGIPTYCFGETSNPVAGKLYSVAECEGLLNESMLAAVRAVERCVPGLPPEVLGAFASAVYNMGPTIACNTGASTAARALRAGLLADACNQLPRWNKARLLGVLTTLPGLTKRRALERDQCLVGAVA